MNTVKPLILLVLTAFVCGFVCVDFARAESGANPLYLDTSAPVEKRVDDLVSRMTLEEKISQMVHDAPAIDHLGIPRYNWWSECLHGVARAGLATVFPQSIGLAATWDTELIKRVATVISDEARAKHHDFVRKGKLSVFKGLTFWSPNINLFRDPRWGRGMETYGEDPYLTGNIGVAFVQGLQGDDPKYLKVVSTVKHFAVHSGPEPDRHTFDARVDERDLQESYLPHFRRCIQEGRAYSVMCAYNRFDGEACCGSKRLLTEILRDEWGFGGYVVSDCDAIGDIFSGHKIVSTPPEAASLAVKSGCDLNCGGVYWTLKDAVEQGIITEDEINVSLKRLFTARFKLGMFDPSDMVPYANIPYSTVDSDEHRNLALETAHKSVVLLKNDGALLPLKKDIGTIAVIGPNADDVEVLLGNYNGLPSEPVTLLAGIQNKVSKKTNVLYAQGCDLAENMPHLYDIPSSALFTTQDGVRRNGLKGEYYDNPEFKGTPVFTRIDEAVDFEWWDVAPVKSVKDDAYSIRWTGELVPPVTGSYAIGASGITHIQLYMDDKLLVSIYSIGEPRSKSAKVDLVAGKSYSIKLDYIDSENDSHIKLLWALPTENILNEAVNTAKKADVVVMVMGLSPRLEGEEMEVPVKGFKGGDRLTLDLPDVQETMLKAIYETGKPIVLVLLNGSALSVNWANDHIPSIIEAWYPGQAAGDAVADVLFGDYNPAGRLPVTFYKSVEQIPPFIDYSMEGRTYRYFRGEPLYPFGYGLSYTRFKYGNLVIPKKVKAGEDIPVSVEVKNAGAIAGEEVVQLYVTDKDTDVPVPIRSLQGFTRITLEPGEKRTVNFTLTPYQLSLIDKNYKRVLEPGTFIVSVGGKQPGFKGTADANTTRVVSGRFKVTGKIITVK